MRKQLIALTVLTILFYTGQGQVVLKKGMIITKSIKIKKSTYALPGADSLDQPVIIIEGQNIVLDFANSVLEGSRNKLAPDKFTGMAILIRNSKNITIKNLSARGYKVALMAVNVASLKIQNCDFSYNYRQHLNSTQQKEDISDWLSHHRNDKDEWLRYGSAMYLNTCTDFSISDCKVTGGQNALMLTNCKNGLVYNNDFSFNSGLGIGMYRSSNNRIMFNRLNFNVRGYSHGVYNRGQDSAGILVYEQSNNNVFYSNSVTHGGDGFFLWAGQTTMDKGIGGCNGNRIWKNDFSYAPTNGIEVTFSSNHINGNRIFECDHGIWGGYSFQTSISGNQFRNNRIAIAIEHGQDNKIENNIFYRDGEAIRLWARKEQPADWAYARIRDTRSADYQIWLNSFNQNPVAYHFSRTDSVNVFNNRYADVGQVFKIDSTVTNLDSVAADLPDTNLIFPTLKNAKDPFRGNARFAGRKNILMTEWGPYDFGYPLIWNTNSTSTSDTMHFSVFGPKGKWKLVSAKGISLPQTPVDSFPAHFSGIRVPDKRTDIEIVAEYAGPAFTDPFGNRVNANKPYRFRFSRFFQPIDFTVQFYAFDSASNPVPAGSVAGFQLQQKPIKAETTSSLDYAWWGGIKVNNQTLTRFLTVAEGSADLQGGWYELGVTWDDAVRVYIDDELLVVDEWNPSQYSFDESPNKKVVLEFSKGIHKFRVEHVELGGFATLSLKLRKLN